MQDGMGERYTPPSRTQSHLSVYLGLSYLDISQRKEEECFNDRSLCHFLAGWQQFEQESGEARRRDVASLTYLPMP